MIHWLLISIFIARILPRPLPSSTGINAGIYFHGLRGGFFCNPLIFREPRLAGRGVGRVDFMTFLAPGYEREKRKGKWSGKFAVKYEIFSPASPLLVMLSG